MLSLRQNSVSKVTVTSDDQNVIGSICAKFEEIPSRHSCINKNGMDNLKKQLLLTHLSSAGRHTVQELACLVSHTDLWMSNGDGNVLTKTLMGITV